MTFMDILACAFLVAGVLGFALTSMGLLSARGLNDQIHYLAPGTLVGSGAISIAIVLREGFSQIGVKTILVLVLLFISNPILSHATARAGRIREERQLPPRNDENIPLVEISK